MSDVCYQKWMEHLKEECGPATWRERAVAARERGGWFTAQDRDAWKSAFMCPVGEATRTVVGDTWGTLRFREVWAALDNKRPNGFGGNSDVAHDAIRLNRPDMLERVLDHLADAALKLKREAVTP